MAPDLDYRNVSFQYEGASSPALRDVQLTIEPGEIVLVTGPAGWPPSRASARRSAT